jgi:TonB family protein
VRLSRPSLVVFCVAVIASLLIHFPVYEVLGVLARAFERVKPEPAPPSQIEFEVADNAPPQAKPPEPIAKPNQKRERQQKAAEKPAKPEQAQKAPTPKVEPPKLAPKLDPKPKPELAPPPPPEPPHQIENKLAVTQKSDDPKVPPPDNARFIAEENRRVAEESVASVRSLTENDDQPSASAPHSAENQGNAEKDDPAELQEVHGEDKRIPDKREAKEKPLAPSELGKGKQRAEAVAQSPTRGGSESKSDQSRDVAAGSEAVGGEDQMLVIQDGAGSIRIRKSQLGHGPGSDGGEPQKGGRAQARREAGGRVGEGSNLKLSWSQFESTFGSEQLREQRDAYLEQHRTKSLGGQREQDWRKFRAAVENFVDQVKPGNQTALNAAASPFAAYLAEVHRSIHREFAMRFLRSLPLVGGAFADSSLVTRLEIVINQDGTLHQVGVIRTSGFTPFDYGAWNAVMRSAPYPEPPKKILSGDGRVYVRWDFYNNERQCGTFNAEPFILPNAGGDPKPTPGPLHDPGGVPPDGKLGLRGKPATGETARLP